MHLAIPQKHPDYGSHTTFRAKVELLSFHNVRQDEDEHHESDETLVRTKE